MSIHLFIPPSIHWSIFFFSISCRQQYTPFLNISSYISLTGVQYLFMQNLYFTQERLNLYICFAKRKDCDSRKINKIHGLLLLGHLWKRKAVWEPLDPQKLLPYGADTLPQNSLWGTVKCWLGQTTCLSVNVNWIWMWKKRDPEA